MKFDFLSTFSWLAIGVLLTMAGDVFLKKSQVYNYKFLILGLVLYAAGVIPVAIIFRKMDFGSVFLAWEALTVILAIVIASIYFKESLTVHKGLALLFALGALYFTYRS